jgi:CO/xanthine dehydrogenase Mo-binding subunit
MSEGQPLSRREFLKISGGGIFIFFAVGDPLELLEAQERMGGRELPSDWNAFLRIAEDGNVTGFTGKAELGQGANTALAQMAAEELDVPLDSVTMVLGDTDLCPWDMGTFGSRTIKYFGPPFRQAAAEARAVLIQLASEKLSVPAGRLATKDGAVFDTAAPKKSVTYGALAIGKKIERHIDPKPAVKRVSEHTISGKPANRKDARLKATGRAEYAADIKIQGMRCARILRPPAHGAKLRTVDTTAAEAVPGAQVIRDGELIAVLHDSFDQADAALAKINAEWDMPEPSTDDETIYDHLVRVAPEGSVVEEKGSLDEGKKLSATVFEGTYKTPYVAHSPVEPHAAVVKIEGDRATVWASTQGPFRVQSSVAEALGFPVEKVRAITPFVGGGFGGKNPSGQAVEAARLAKLSRKPVQVCWSRREEFFLDSFQPAAVVKITSGLDAAKKIVLWDYTVFFGGERTSQPFYDIPHYRILSKGNWGGRGGGGGAHPFAVGAWRAPGSNTNTFARESHMDVMAARAGIDPVAFRMANLKDDRMKRALQTCATKFGWKPAKSPSGRGQGVALVNYLGTYVATMAQVEADKASGRVQVKRVVCAQDMGEVINPDGAMAQIQGCITMGLGYCLTEEMHFRNGEIRDINYDTYEIPQFSWLPKIETILIDNPSLAPQGGGEPPIVNMGAVVANAVFDATGARLFRLPITPERLRDALAAKS